MRRTWVWTAILAATIACDRDRQPKVDELGGAPAQVAQAAPGEKPRAGPEPVKAPDPEGDVPAQPTAQQETTARRAAPPDRAAATGRPEAERRRSARASTDPLAGDAVALVEMQGTLRSRSGERLEIVDEEGAVYEVFIDDRTRARNSEGRAVGIRSLPRGSEVRASFAFTGGEFVAREITVLPEGDTGLEAPRK